MTPGGIWVQAAVPHRRGMRWRNHQRLTELLPCAGHGGCIGDPDKDPGSGAADLGGAGRQGLRGEHSRVKGLGSMWLGGCIYF